MVRLDVRVFTPSMTRRRPSTRFESTTHRQRRRSTGTWIQVYVIPTEREQFGDTQTQRERDDVQGLQSVAPHVVEEHPCLFWSHRPPFGLHHLDRIGQSSNVAVHQSLDLSPSKGAPQHRTGQTTRVGAVAIRQVCSRLLHVAEHARDVEGTQLAQFPLPEPGTHVQPDDLPVLTFRYRRHRAGENVVEPQFEHRPHRQILGWHRQVDVGKSLNLTHASKDIPLRLPHDGTAELLRPNATVAVGDVRPSDRHRADPAPLRLVLTNAAFAVRTYPSSGRSGGPGG